MSNNLHYAKKCVDGKVLGRGGESLLYIDEFKNYLQVDW